MACLGCAAASIAAWAQEPPASVSTIVAEVVEWPDDIEAVGSLRAARGSDLAAEVSGIVDWIGFDSGRDVTAGTVLLRLRSNDDAARAAELQAAVDLAASNAARDQKQFRAQAVSQASLDADDSRLRAARAQLAQHQAQIDEKIVRAPFAGRLGLRQVDVGQYLAAGSMVVTLQALDPIYVDFYLPQQALSRVVPGASVAVTIDAYAGQKFAGTVAAISPKIDPASRMAQIRATLANPDHKLLPGMFATVALSAGKPMRVITLPNTAIVYNPYGSLVYVVKPGNPATVQQAMVQTGATRGDQVAVTGGLSEGTVVVTAGQIKLRPGSAVVVNNDFRPSNDAAPQPTER